MPRVKIVADAGVGQGRLWLDDVEVKELVDIHVSMGFEDITRVKLTCNVEHSLDIQVADGKIYPTFHVFPGYTLVETIGTDGSKRYHVEPIIADVKKMIGLLDREQQFSPKVVFGVPFTPFLDSQFPNDARCQRGDCTRPAIGTLHIAEENFYICEECKKERYP